TVARMRMALQPACFYRIRFNHLHNWIHESPILCEREVIVRCQGTFYCPLRCGCHELDAAHKNAHRLRWSRMDRERKHRIQDCRRHDIQQSATFLEPGRLPRFYHRMGFVPVKTVRGEYVSRSLHRSATVPVNSGGSSLVSSCRTPPM